MRPVKITKVTQLVQKNRKLFAIIAILVVVIAAGSIFVILQEDAQLRDNYNQQIKGLTTASTGYLVNNYNLYYGSASLKYKSLLTDYLGENSILQKFRISDMAGNVVFDSSIYQSESSQNPGKLDGTYLDLTQKSEPTYLFQGGKIETAVVPLIGDWGSHQYSVIFDTSLNTVNKYIFQFNVEAILIAVLLAVVVGVLITTFVLMERYALERIQKKKIEVLDQRRREFIMLASHNLRTPLTQINGYISLLTEMNLTKEQLSLLVPASEATDKLGEIIDNILTISNVEDKEMEKKVITEKLNLMEIISEILEKNTEPVEKNNLKVSVNVVPKDLELFINKNYLIKILNAIIVNAIKFNKKDGDVDINVTTDQNMIHFTVADTGIGIKENEQRNIYTIFHRGTTKDPLVYDYDGVGVGLYMSRLLVEYLGGTIWFESTINKGTTFHINLPTSRS